MSILREHRWRLSAGTSHRTEIEVLHSHLVKRRMQQEQRRTTVLHQPRHEGALIAPLFTTLLGSLGITGTTASVLGAIATTAVVAGIQYLMRPKPPKPSDGKLPVMQEIPNCIWAVGETRLAGALLLLEQQDRILYGVQALCAHPSDSITQYYLNDDPVSIGVSNRVGGLSDGRYADDLISIEHRLGAVPATPYLEHVEFLASTGLWTSNHRCDGQTTLGFIARPASNADMQKRYPYGRPVPTVVGRWAKVWDFRDSGQSAADQSTWEWSDNPVLILAWHECFSEFGNRRDYTRAILPVLDLWKAEADVCDETVPMSGGGTRKRYRCNGWDTTANDPKVGTNAILATMDGWICERPDGALLVVAGKFREAYCGVITDADIAGVSTDSDVVPSEEINRLIPIFTYRDTDYTRQDTDYWEDAGRQLINGVRAEEADYGWVTDWRQARWLGWRDWCRWQMRHRGTLDVRLSGINCVFRRWNRVQSSFYLPELDGKIVEFRQVVLALMQGGYRAQFIEHPEPEVIDLVSTTLDGTKPPVPEKTLGSGLPIPVIVSVEPYYADGTSAFLSIVIDDPEAPDLATGARYRLTAVSPGGPPGDWVSLGLSITAVSGGTITFGSAAVPDLTDIDVQCVFVAGGSTLGDWSSAATVTY